MNKKILSKLFMTVLIFFITFSFTTCGTLSSVVQDPKISIHSMDVTNITFNGVQMLCKVRVENPNSFEIPFPETDWEFFLNTNSFIKGTVKNNQRIKARNSTIVDVPVSFNYVQVFNTFASLKGTRQANYKIALGVKIPMPVFGDKTWNIQHEGNVPMPQLPRLNSPSMTVGNVDLTRAEILVNLNFENPNSFQLPAPKITYNYHVNRNSFIRGNVDNNTPLAANTTTPVSFRLQVTYADLFRSFASLVTQREVASMLSISCDFGIPAFAGEPFTREINGTLPLRR